MRKVLTTVNFRSIAIVSSLLLLSACGSGDQYADIRSFMSEVENEPRGKIAPLPEFEPYQPFTYGSANLRSPFEPPVVIPVLSEEQQVNRGVKPPVDHVKQYLERFNLAALIMVGSLEQDGSTWALIEDADSGVHRVQVGDFMGTSWGQIESINDTRIDIIEIVSDGGGGWLKRPRSIALKSIAE
jgi:type IV pilus assembly protein PilP